jgi:hypothetical protein
VHVRRVVNSKTAIQILISLILIKKNQETTTWAVDVNVSGGLVVG